MRSVFSDIYSKNSWGSAESRSGPGSAVSRTGSIRRGLLNVISAYNITSVVDCPCGDLNWISPIVDRIPNYLGIDIVDDLVRDNKGRYPHLRFERDDITTSSLLGSDLLIVRDTLFHFSQEDVKKAIMNIKRNGPKYLLTTEIEDATHANRDIRTGTWYPIALRNAPYNFPEPILKIAEDSPNKFMSLWRVEDLPEYSAKAG